MKIMVSTFIILLLFSLLVSSCQFFSKKTYYQYPLEELTPVQFPNDYFKKVPIEIYKSNSDNIPILMYHSIDDPVNWIDTQTFRKHLELLFEAGFSTIKLQDYLKNNYESVPEGRKPIILTFDDQWGSQFYYEDTKGTKISKNCVVGILEDFAKLHPSFGKNAIFYLFFHRLPFLKSEEDHILWKKKLIYLVNAGFEIGSHTYDHSKMTNMKPNKILEELDFFYSKLLPILGKQTTCIMTLAYPGGEIPKNSTMIKNYQFHGVPLLAALKASGGFAKVPVKKNINMFELPRLEGSTENIRWIIQQHTFTVHKKIVPISKIFTYSKNSILQWLQTNYIQKDFFFRELY
jgi:peptidoglycan/xylan/chitin deacetylase (PgdA/CDA1 family)